MIQKGFRGMLGRRAYRAEWVRHCLSQFATVVQANYRSRQGRKRTAAQSRATDTRRSIWRQRRQSGILLRRLRLGHRRNQRRWLWRLERAGVHPESFNLDWRRLARECVNDCVAFMEFVFFYVRMWRVAKFNDALRSEMKANFEAMVIDRAWPRKGDAVRIIAKGHARRGGTGFVINVKSAADVPGGETAEVKLDSDGSIIFISLFTPGTATEDAAPSMKKEPHQWQNTLPFQSVHVSRDVVMLQAEQERIRRSEMCAAQRIQTAVRGGHARHWYKHFSSAQMHSDKLKQAFVHRIMAKMRCASIRTGRALVRTRAVTGIHPRQFRRLSPTPIVPHAVTRVVNLYIDQRDRQQRVNETIKQRKCSQLSVPSMYRWRRLTPWKRRVCRVTGPLAERVLHRVADKLDHHARTLARRKPSRLTTPLLPAFRVAARVAGAWDWKRSTSEKNTWIGKYVFAGWKNSPHMDDEGHAVYHGVWDVEWAHPHGRGVACCLIAPRAGVRRGRACLASAPKRYHVLDTLWNMGRVVPNSGVCIHLSDGSTYEGPFVVDTVSRKHGHYGRWVARPGTLHEGHAVDNHFDVDLAPPGHFRVTFVACANGNHSRTGKGPGAVRRLPAIYEGDTEHGQRHGFGYCRYPDGDVYVGGWAHGLRHGKGRLVTDRNGQRCSYEGWWHGDEKSGLGEHSFADRSAYRGEYGESFWSGRGKLQMPAGESYEGGFEQSVYDGCGICATLSGNIYAGRWKEDVRDDYTGLTLNVAPDGRVYNVGFSTGLMHGKGTVVELTAGWPLKKCGLWRAGKLCALYSTGASRGATDEFCGHFRSSRCYQNMFAMAVSQNLPQLPPGVDGQDPRVMEHVAGMLLHAGQLAGANAVAKAHAEVAPIRIMARTFWGNVKEAKAHLFHAKGDARRQEQEVDAVRREASLLEQECQALKNTINVFWKNDPAMTKYRYNKARDAVASIPHIQWYTLKAQHKPPASIVDLLTSFCDFFLLKADWKQGQMLCNSSKLNEDLGDRDALIRIYDVKLLDELSRWDVYRIAEEPDVLRRIGNIVHNPAMCRDNLEIKRASKCGPLVVDLLHAMYHYAHKACQVLATQKKMDALILHLQHTRAQWHEEEEILNHALDVVRSRNVIAHDFERKAEEYRRQLYEAELTLRRSSEYAQKARKSAHLGWALSPFEACMDVVETSVEDALGRLVCGVAGDIVVPDVGACVKHIVDSISAAGSSLQGAIGVAHSFIDVNLNVGMADAGYASALMRESCGGNKRTFLCSLFHLHPHGKPCVATAVDECDVDNVFEYLSQSAKCGSNVVKMFSEDIDANCEHHAADLATNDQDATACR